MKWVSKRLGPFWMSCQPTIQRRLPLGGISKILNSFLLNLPRYRKMMAALSPPTSKGV